MRGVAKWVPLAGVLSLGASACGARSELPTSTSTSTPGDDDGGRLQPGNDTPGPPPPSGTHVACISKISAGGTSACALRNDGALYCWGDNTLGQLGVTASAMTLPPTRVTALKAPVTDVSAGFKHTCVTTSEGKAWCFGNNWFGQLGNGKVSPSYDVPEPVPQAVVGLPSAVKVIAAGGSHTCALLGDGTLWCWGNGGYGELGIGFMNGAPGVSHPERVNGLGNPVTLIAPGDVHTCATTSDDQIWCWGNATGPAMYGDDAVSPLRVASSAGIRALSAGAGFTCLIDAAKKVQCWGRSDHGELGDGTVGDLGTLHDTPAPVVGIDTGVAQIAARGGHACARTEAGRVYCWGENDHAEAGFASPFEPLPKLVQAIVAADDLAVGDEFVCVRTAGEVWCWGNSEFGQLGPSASRAGAFSAEPVRVPIECP